MMFRQEISREEMDQMDLIQFEGPITVIQTKEDLESETDHLMTSQLLGFDTESRPSFKKGRVYPTSLIQLATAEHAWVIRVGRMGYPPRLMDLLSSDEIIKVGVGRNDDLRRLRSDHRFKPGGFLDLQDYVEAFRIGEKGLKKLSAIILGRRISKSQQVSNWDADILSEAQLRYAATDAWICLKIYQTLRKSLYRHHE